MKKAKKALETWKGYPIEKARYLYIKKFMQKWLYEGQEIESLSQFPQGCVGFVYMITNTTNGKIYIGKKTLFNTLTKKLTKKEASAWDKPGRIPKKKKETKESNWSDYNGSNKNLQEDIKLIGPQHFHREILEFCFNKKQCTYYEEMWQHKLRVLHIDSYNDTIAGRYYRRDVKPDPEMPQSSSSDGIF